MRSNSRVGSDLLIDRKANSFITVVDGASRTLKTIQHMRWRGQGQNPPAANLTLLPASAGTIVTALILDGNGRQTQLIDDRGNVTQFLWDTLDRETVTIFQDGSTRTNAYDLASDVITYTDENGSIFANTFDALSRKVESGVSPASGVSDATTSQAFRYDGLSRTTYAENTGSAGTSAVSLFYDSIGRVLEDSQSFGGNTRDVTNSAFTSIAISGFTLPGGQTFSHTRDALYRPTVMSSGGSPFAEWFYFGPARVAEMQLITGLLCTWMNNSRSNSAVQASGERG